MPVTNTQLIEHLMEKAKSGVMMQIVILQALDTYSKQVLAAKPGYLSSASALIDEGSWTRCCQEIQDSLNNRDQINPPGPAMDPDVEYVRLDADNLNELRMAAMGAIGVLKKYGTTTTVTALQRGLRVTGDAYVDELVHR